ncbi:EAL domain-containing protein [Paraglaciecola sp. L3A3]|uniref:EAL domain-containing protein n=1 Tax=Paraglaciecola sp. L3A3 TaxID=2686358 RepID=UPI00131C7B4A|nr:EAL domain-containing protein [Paraglaciecola sp. L3A3]
MNFIFLFCLRFCLLLSLWQFAANAAPNSIDIKTDDTKINLAKHIQWIVAEDYIQLSGVQNLTGWQENTIVEPLLEHQNLWGRITLNFADEINQPYFLSIGNPALDLVDIYFLDDKNRILSSSLMGAKRNLSQRPFNHRLFITPIDTHQQSITIFLKIKDQGPLVFSIHASKQSYILQEEQILLAAIGCISGGLALLACYFLISYIIVRSPIRFWFALSSASFVLLFLNTSGILSQITGITAYITQTSLVLIGILILTSSKVAFSLLQGVPPIWRYVFYCIGSSMFAVAVVVPHSEQISFTLGLCISAILLIAILAIFYHKADNKFVNIVSLLGLIFIVFSGFSQIALFFSHIALAQNQSLLFASLIMFGIILMAIAIEAHEKMLNNGHSVKQQLTTSNLQHFYNLFQNSAEGLYTSTLDGQLVSINPAMSSLFGYDNDKQMLEEINNASQFYADPQDRDLLLGEIHQNGKVMGKEIKGLKKDGSEFWFSISGQIKEEQDQRYVFGSIFDITERKQSVISLEHMASHDPLTGVYNRREFEKLLSAALKKAPQAHHDLALLYMDLDQFKLINDTCGHKAGDLLISQLSHKIDQVVTGKGILARLGGDEFAVLLEDANAQMAYLLANRILNVVAEFRFIWENSIFTLGISIGQVSWQPDITTPEQLLSMADSACYMAKERGRNQIHTYSQEDKGLRKYESELFWLNKINQAIEHNQFELFYQHYLALNKANSGHHYEILLRLKEPDGQLVAPGVFLPSAERFNLTAKIDRWVIENYFNWLSNNPQHMTALAKVNINLNGHSLVDKELKLYVLNAFEKYQIPHNKVCFEITESMAILKMDEALEFINTFNKLGCKFALDDFGSGFSSYGYLKRLPVNQLKIDGSFVKNILIEPIDMAMVNSIKDVAKAMDMETTAEFVESVDVMVQLGKMGIDYAQGYGVAKPCSLAKFTAL